MLTNYVVVWKLADDKNQWKTFGLADKQTKNKNIYPCFANVNMFKFPRKSDQVQNYE